MSFPPHPVPGGMLSRSKGMPSRKDGPPNIWDTHDISGNVFANPAAAHHRRGRMRIKHQFKIRDASPDFQPKNQSSLVRETLQRIMGRPTTTADFGSSFRQIPYTSYACLLEDKIQDCGMFLFTISYGSYAVDPRSGVG